jgi:type II secretory pathway component PulK
MSNHNNQEEQQRLDQCLQQLSTLLEAVGVSNYEVPQAGEQASWQQSDQQVDPHILHRFCVGIEQLYLQTWLEESAGTEPE